MAEPGGAADDPVRKVQKTLGVALFEFHFLLKGGSSWADNIPVHERPSRSSPLPPSNPLLSYHHSLHKARAGAGTGPLPSWQPCLPQGRAVAGVQGGVGLAVPGGRGSCVWKGGEGRWTLLLGVILLLGPIDRWRRWHVLFKPHIRFFFSWDQQALIFYWKQYNTDYLYQGRICQFRYLLYRSNCLFLNIFTVTAMMNRSPSDEYDILFNTLFIFT